MKSWRAPLLPVPGPVVPGRVTVHDTAARAVIPVGPATGTARMYVCGITPYDATHLGHAFTYLTFDLLNRAWRDAGLDVVYTQNVTDVDDPLLERATATGVDWEELAQDQTDLFRTDMEALRVIPPAHYQGAVESIDLVSGLLETLRGTGTIYQVDDPQYPDWYFTVDDHAYGSICHLDHADQVSVFGERGGDPDRPGKRRALDALVWRLERPGEPAWDSPLGRGRPGWHIECTGIALEHLGTDFDVQGGGSDLEFPHHEMSAVEGTALTGEPFAKAYVHVAMVGLDGEKMSKSRGNLILVSSLRRSGVDPMAIRLALLDHHYRTAWEWTSADLPAAEERLALWRAAVAGSRSVDATFTLAAVRTAVRTDLHADDALAAVDAWAAASVTAAADVPGARADVAGLVDGLLGVTLD